MHNNISSIFFHVPPCVLTSFIWITTWYSTAGLGPNWFNCPLLLGIPGAHSTLTFQENVPWAETSHYILARNTQSWPPVLAWAFPGSDRTKSFPVLMLVIKCRTCTWCVVYLFLCLLFLPFPLMQSSTAREKDEQALPVGSSGPVCTCSCACGQCGAGLGGRGAHVLNRSSSPLEYWNGLIYGCGCTLWPTVTANWLLTVTDKCISGTRCQSLSSLFHLAWALMGVERLRFLNCIPRDVELIFGDSGGNFMLEICFLCVSACA